MRSFPAGELRLFHAVEDSHDYALRCIPIGCDDPSATEKHLTSISHPCVNYFTLRNFKGVPWVDVKLVSLRANPALRRLNPLLNLLEVGPDPVTRQRMEKGQELRHYRLCIITSTARVDAVVAVRIRLVHNPGSPIAGLYRVHNRKNASASSRTYTAHLQLSSIAEIAARWLTQGAGGTGVGHNHAPRLQLNAPLPTGRRCRALKCAGQSSTARRWHAARTVARTPTSSTAWGSTMRSCSACFSGHLDDDGAS
jgi:hypothetical protein